MSLNLQAYSTRYSNNILRMASYFEPYVMHFIEINYMSCPVFTCKRQNIEWSLSHGLLYSFIVLKYVILSYRKMNNFQGELAYIFGDLGRSWTIFRDLGSGGKYS